MKNRHSREKTAFLALLNAAASERLPDKQLQRERMETFWMFFQPSKRKSKGFWRRTERDEKRRGKARRAVIEDKVIVPNRAQLRALGDRKYSHGLGRLDIPKGRR